jgi:nitroreductase
MKDNSARKFPANAMPATCSSQIFLWMADDLNFILEAGRLSPSSFGLEQWKFLVLTAPPQAGPPGRLFQPAPGGLRQRGDRDPGPPGGTGSRFRLRAPAHGPGIPGGRALEGALKNYRGFHAATDVKAWSAAQCHIAAANMMTAAAGIGIDSCAIGGFVPAECATCSEIDPLRDLPALILPLGYCAPCACRRRGRGIPLSQRATDPGSGHERPHRSLSPPDCPVDAG